MKRRREREREKKGGLIAGAELSRLSSSKRMPTESEETEADQDVGRAAEEFLEADHLLGIEKTEKHALQRKGKNPVSSSNDERKMMGENSGEEKDIGE